MSDDIVKRLRKAEVAGVLIPCDDLKEAADEIERLRESKLLLRELFNCCLRCNDFRPDSSLGNRIVAFFLTES